MLVVTHLAQVAAFADAQVEVHQGRAARDDHDVGRPARRAERVVEIARMLSGSPDSDTAQQHAEELLTAAGHALIP